MNCPKCNAAMEAVEFDEIEVDRCTDCGGLWFDILERETLKERAGSGAIDTGDAERGKAHNAIGKIDCPNGHTRMVRMVDHEQPHIWYEQCSTCGGAYFDAGEFKDYRTVTPADLIRRWRAKARP